MVPLQRGQETELIEISASWYLDDLPPMLFIKKSPNILVLRDRRDEKPYCITGECSRKLRCLTKRAPVASLILRPSRSSFSDFKINAY